jgi:hypothetical protein
MTICLNLSLIALSIALGIMLGHGDTGEELDVLKGRIKELNEKSTQLLIFLSFAIAAVVFLGYGSNSAVNNPVSQRISQSGVLRWWVVAIFPVIIGVLPLKEFGRNKPRWYRVVIWLKFWLLWVAIFDIVVGAVKFYRVL